MGRHGAALARLLGRQQSREHLQRPEGLPEEPRRRLPAPRAADHAGALKNLAAEGILNFSVAIARQDLKVSIQIDQ